MLRLLTGASLVLAAIAACVGDDPPFANNPSTTPDGGVPGVDGSTTPGVDGSSGGGMDAGEDAETDGDDAGTGDVLLTNQDRPVAIAVNDGIVYWAIEAGAIRACDPTSCQATLRNLTSAVRALAGPRLVATSTHLYWVSLDRNRLYRCQLPLCPDPPARIYEQDGGSTESFALDGAEIFFADKGNALKRCSVASCALPTTLTIPAAPASNLAIGGPTQGQLYWISDTSLFRLAKDGTGTPQALADNLVNVTSVTPSETKVYVAQAGDGGMSSGAISFADSISVGATGIFAGGQSAPRSVVVEGTRVYWVASAVGAVRSCNAPDCNGTISLARGQQEPYALTVDATHVYWVNRAGGQIMRAAKP